MKHKDSKELIKEDYNEEDDTSTKVERLSKCQKRNLKKKKSGKVKDAKIEKLTNQPIPLSGTAVFNTPVFNTHERQAIASTSESRKDFLFYEFTPLTETIKLTHQVKQLEDRNKHLNK